MDAYTDACALNNLGVTMMLQGDHDNAAKVLKDALSALRMAISEDNDMAQQEFLKTFVQQKLRQASALVCQLPGSSHQRRRQQAQQQQHLKAVESSDVQSLKKATENNHVCVAVLIRDRVPGCVPNQDICCIDAGIVLYNYGLSCFILSRQQQQQHQPAMERGRQMKQQVFYSMARTALVTAHKTFSSEEDEGGCRDLTVNLQTAFLSMIVLSCTSQVLRAGNEYAKAEEAKQALQKVLSQSQRERLSSVLLSEELIAGAA